MSGGLESDGVLELFIQPTMALLPLAVGNPATPLTETYTFPYLSNVRVNPMPSSLSDLAGWAGEIAKFSVGNYWKWGTTRNTADYGGHFETEQSAARKWPFLVA